MIPIEHAGPPSGVDSRSVNKRPSSLLGLPTELQRRIVSTVQHPEDLGALALTSKLMRGYVNDQIIIRGEGKVETLRTYVERLPVRWSTADYTTGREVGDRIYAAAATTALAAAARASATPSCADPRSGSKSSAAQRMDREI